jgi:hypothetical protein
MSNAKITFLDRIKALFAKDKEEFWFKHFTDEEKELKRMDAWQLAEVINEARVRNSADMEVKRIVAEHMLNVRLANIQARPNYFALFVGLAGVIGGVFLTSALQKPQEQPKCVCDSKHEYKSQNNETSRVKPIAPIGKNVDIPKNTESRNDSNPKSNNKR